MHRDPVDRIKLLRPPDLVAMIGAEAAHRLLTYYSRARLPSLGDLLSHAWRAAVERAITEQGYTPQDIAEQYGMSVKAVLRAVNEVRAARRRALARMERQGVSWDEESR